ncbi:GAF and ANTAR domain-containing protein [Streptomyces phytohabitans]|uniref:GAF and ANTAR domain-containing protein n=1 Tax=Streptomyces phytohabitans TaxID=1150371 RepID=UPI00345BBCF9
MPDRTWEEFAVQLAGVARDLLAQESVQDTLDRIAEHTVELVDGCEAAGILSLDSSGVHTLSASNSLVYESDRLQEKSGEGPCFDAARTGEAVLRIRDLTTWTEHWPVYTPRARELGIGSMMGFLLYTRTDTLGALNVYSTRPDAFTEASEHVGWLLASHAAVAFSSARTHEQLQTAMGSRHTIGAAVGVVMERYGITEDQAFAVLTKSSQDHNTKLRDVARTVTETGKVPGAK